jgi:hypothetical protein
MFFREPKPTVTLDDKGWIEEAFIWFEQQYGQEFLKNVVTITPTKDFFPLDFKGTEENAQQLTAMICDYMQIKGVKIDLHYFSDKPLELAEGILTTQSNTGPGSQNRNKLGTYSEKGRNKYSIGIELELLKDPTTLIATIAHELSHLTLLGEGRLHENDEELTDINTIVLGFGIFTANSIFRFQQFQSTSHQGWQAKRSGYIPEQVAAYCLALLTNYQKKDDSSWTQFLNKSVKKMYDRNLKYLRKTADEIKFR